MPSLIEQAVHAARSTASGDGQEMQLSTRLPAQPLGTRVGPWSASPNVERRGTQALTRAAHAAFTAQASTAPSSSITFSAATRCMISQWAMVPRHLLNAALTATWMATLVLTCSATIIEVRGCRPTKTTDSRVHRIMLSYSCSCGPATFPDASSDCSAQPLA